MKILKTPSERFRNLPGYSFQENYCDIKVDNQFLKMHFVDFGEAKAPLVLMLHGEPSWSYLYRNMITKVAERGFRVIAPDLIGFGKSDKLGLIEDYTYARHLDWLSQFVETLQLHNILLFCQDWGGLLGLRLVADKPALFSGVVAANTMLPTGDYNVPEAFKKWQQFAATDPAFDIGSVLQMGTSTDLIDEVVQAYNAPFPSEEYKAGARAFPLLVPTTPYNIESENNRNAWKKLASFDKPFVTAFSNADPVTAGAEKVFKKLIPGSQGQVHSTINGGGHFLQEDCSDELSDVIIALGANIFS